VPRRKLESARALGLKPVHAQAATRSTSMAPARAAELEYVPAHAAPLTTSMAPALAPELEYVPAHAAPLSTSMAPALAPELEYAPAHAAPLSVPHSTPTSRVPPASAPLPPLPPLPPSPPLPPARKPSPAPAHASKSTRRRRRYIWGFIIRAVLVAGAIGWVAMKLDSQGNTPKVRTASATIGGTTTIGNGTWRVGIKKGMIAPGNYQTAGGLDCYWERDRNLTGTENAILASDDLIGPGVVTILPTDAGFKTENCGTWSPLPATGPQSKSFGDGAYAVGITIAAGTYVTAGGSHCYWEQDQDYTGDKSSIISNHNTFGPVTLAIPASTREFKTQGCGTWHIS